jgi:hypothetical protein
LDGIDEVRGGKIVREIEGDRLLNPKHDAKGDPSSKVKELLTGASARRSRQPKSDRPPAKTQLAQRTAMQKRS